MAGLVSAESGAGRCVHHGVSIASNARRPPVPRPRRQKQKRRVMRTVGAAQRRSRALPRNRRMKHSRVWAAARMTRMRWGYQVSCTISMGCVGPGEVAERPCYATCMAPDRRRVDGGATAVRRPRRGVNCSR